MRDEDRRADSSSGPIWAALFSWQIKCKMFEAHKHTRATKLYSTHTHSRSKYSRRRVTHFVSLHIQKSQWQTDRKTTRSQVKEEVSAPRKRKKPEVRSMEMSMWAWTHHTFVHAVLNSTDTEPQTSKRQRTAKTDRPHTAPNNTLIFQCGEAEIWGAYWTATASSTWVLWISITSDYLLLSFLRPDEFHLMFLNVCGSRNVGKFSENLKKSPVSYWWFLQG